MFPMCRFQDTPLQIPDSKIPSMCRFLKHTPGQIPDSEFPSFRGPLLGPSPRDPQIPDSEFPSFRGPLYGVRTSSVRGTPIFQIPSFRVRLVNSEASSCSVQARGPPNSRFPVSEFPRTPPLGSTTTNSLIPSVIQPRALYVRRAQIPEYREQFLFPLLYLSLTKQDPQYRCP